MDTLKHSITLLAKHLRYPLLGMLLALCGAFFLRQWDYSPPSVIATEAADICASTPGCRSVSFQPPYYDPALQRRTPVLQVTVERRASGADVRSQVLATLDTRQGSWPFWYRWYWAGRRAEVRHE